jgi:hypothetical protein
VCVVVGYACVVLGVGAAGWVSMYGVGGITNLIVRGLGSACGLRTSSRLFWPKNLRMILADVREMKVE